jgi:hypothetical protein
MTQSLQPAFCLQSTATCAHLPAQSERHINCCNHMQHDQLPLLLEKENQWMTSFAFLLYAITFADTFADLI